MVAVCGVAATTTVRHSHQPPPLCALPRPVRCVCVCWWWDWAQRRTVVARTLVWRCAWRLTTTPTSHAVHACRLSPLSCPQTHPPTHTNGTAHSTHTWRALCASSHPLTHTLVASLPTHPPHTLVGVRVLIHLLSCAITHSAGTGVALAWLLWCCGHHHHAPCATHTGTGGGRHGGGWWWACGHCVAATPRHPLALPATTHATSTTTHTMACCLFGTPCHSHHHHSTPSHTHTTTATVPQWWLPLVTTPSTHTPHLPHTPHTPRASTGVAVAFGVAPPPRWCWPFAVFSSSLLVHQPLSLSLSLACTHTPIIPSSTPPSHPSPVCGVCVVGMD